MNKIKIVALGTAASLVLAGCAGTSGTVTSTPTTTTATVTTPTNSTVTNIVNACKTACGYAPDATAILALIPTFPAGTAASLIVQAVCAAINLAQSNPNAAASRAGSVMINGTAYPTVVVHGVTIPYAPTGTVAAAKLKASPSKTVIINGISIPYTPAQ